jgi:TetR/AcrR family transcriptional repressor of nem operon
VARTREFDRDEALDRAMHVFWDKGYEATSLPDLLAAMGIARQSLYDTFGDKHALFLDALDHYESVRGAKLQSCLESATSVRRAFRELFLSIVDETIPEKRRGCMGITAAVELGARDPEVAKATARRQRAVEAIFFRALESARESGEMPRAEDTRALARFLLAALSGLRVSAATAPDPAALRDIVDITLQAFD